MKVVCGSDATLVLDANGSVMACGNNEYDKLCLNRCGSILAKRRMKPRAGGEAVEPPPLRGMCLPLSLTKPTREGEYCRVRMNTLRSFKSFQA